MLALIGGWAGPVLGQASATLAVSTPQTIAFPEITVEFKLNDSTGYPIRNLDPYQLTVIENDIELPVTSLSESYRGTLFVLAINGDREMDIRDATGASRYQKIADALEAWAAGWHFSGKDSWSVMTNNGLQVGNSSDAVTWMTALEAYQPNFRQLEPELTSLQEAVQMLQRIETPFGVDKSLLYVTPPPTADQIDGVNALAQQARQAGIQVNVWMVGEAYFLTNDQGGSLVEMAASTGGQFYHYAGSETLPDLNGALNDLGYVAVLTYESAVRETRTFPLAIRADIGDIEVSGESLPFYIDVQPPNPMLLSPPVSITLQPITDEDADSYSFDPAQLDLQILLEFPDGHQRPLTASRLLVDGSVVDVNVSAPFDVFSWGLTGLTESGEHTIQVEVEDSLGLTGATLLTPVQVEIIEPGLRGNWSLQQVGLVVSGAVAGAGLVLLGVWYFRKRLQANRPNWASRTGTIGSGQASSLPDEEAIEPQQYAALIPLNSFDETGLAITKERVVLGSDPQQANLVLSGPGITPVQAELRLEEDCFWLQSFDPKAGSVRVNYQPVGPGRVQLKPGDLLHFGECGFRFTMVEYESEKQISVTRYEPYP